MINNILEMWYWSFMLIALVGIGIYQGIKFVRHLWFVLKNRKNDD